jgi:superfamily II DNA/RNA helicase
MLKQLLLALYIAGMTIAQSVMGSIMTLEEIVGTRWVNRALILCPDDSQCESASRLLASLDYVVEKIVSDDITSERGFYYSSIHRLRKGLSRVLVTTPDVLSTIQKDVCTALDFDVVLT